MKILYFSPIYYSDMKQRPQQIAEFLSKDHQIYYIEPTISLIRQLLKGGKSCIREQRKVNDNLTVIRLNGCFTFHKSIEILDLLGVNNWWELLQLRKLIRECHLIWVGYSGWYTIIRHIKRKPIIFDKMDEEDMLVSSNMWKKTLQRNKRKMVKVSDVIIVTCQKFYEEIKRIGKTVYLIPNAVAEEFMEKTFQKDREYKEITKVKRIGYIGTIGEWFDMEIVEELLSINPEYEIILVGRNYLPENENPRVRYLGVKKNEELPEIIKNFDVCLYNFKKSELLDTINPVKVYEYLAANKPVLAVESMETLKLKQYLMIYNEKKEIGQWMSQPIKRPFRTEEERKEFIRKNGWKARAQEINQILSFVEEMK